MAFFNHDCGDFRGSLDFPVKSPCEIETILFDVYPQTKDRFSIIEVDETTLKMWARVHYDDLRPGSTISGPSMFTLADCAMYARILGVYEEQVQAVTTNVCINFFEDQI